MEPSADGQFKNDDMRSDNESKTSSQFDQSQNTEMITPRDARDKDYNKLFKNTEEGVSAFPTHSTQCDSVNT